MSETIVEQSQDYTDEIIEEYNSTRGYESTIQDSDNNLPLTEEEMTILDQAVEEAHQEIPINSATLLVDETTSRFSSAIWYEKIQTKTITLAGVGGIGRFGNLINF